MPFYIVTVNRFCGLMKEIVSKKPIKLVIEAENEKDGYDILLKEINAAERTLPENQLFTAKEIIMSILVDSHQHNGETVPEKHDEFIDFVKKHTLTSDEFKKFNVLTGNNRMIKIIELEEAIVKKNEKVEQQDEVQQKNDKKIIPEENKTLSYGNIALICGSLLLAYFCKS